MGSKPFIKDIARDLGQAFDYILQISQNCAIQEIEIKRLQERVASLEAKNSSK